MPRHAKLTVFDVAEVAISNKLIFERCQPLQPLVIDECKGFDNIIKNCPKIAKNYQKTFQDPIKEQINNFLTEQDVATSSPIIEAIHSISELTEFKEAKSKKLYIFSDMVAKYA